MGDKSDRTRQLGEDASRIDIAHQKHRGIDHPGHAHVDDVVALQVDLCRRARPFDQDDVVRPGETTVGRLDLRGEPAAVREVIAGGHGSPRKPVHDHLAPPRPLGLEQDGVHVAHGVEPRRLRLHRLRPSDFKPVLCNIRIKRHILRLKRRYLVAVLFKHPAKSGCNKAFAGI